MSFILDALRKSEHARQHLGGATLAELPLGRRTRSQPWWVIALAALLVINLIVLMIVLLRRAPEAAVVVQPPAPTASQRPRIAAPTTIVASPTPLAEEAAAPVTLQYETPVPRDQSSFDVSTPDGPTLVKRIDSPVSNVANVANVAPATTANGLPELRIDMHVYAKQPKDRFVFINMHKYTEGQTLTEGPRIAEITPDGVILLYQGQQLSLSRP